MAAPGVGAMPPGDTTCAPSPVLVVFSSLSAVFRPARRTDHGLCRRSSCGSRRLQPSFLEHLSSVGPWAIACDRTADDAFPQPAPSDWSDASCCPSAARPGRAHGAGALALSRSVSRCQWTGLAAGAPRAPPRLSEAAGLEGLPLPAGARFPRNGRCGRSRRESCWTRRRIGWRDCCRPRLSAGRWC